jgi:hypothetical protein
MRLWVYKVWRQHNESPMQSAGPKENLPLERLIHEYGEIEIALAWLLYVSADPRPYCTDSDSKDYTRFPLAAFLKVGEGYVVEACELLGTGDLKTQAERLKGSRPALIRGLSRAFKSSDRIASQWAVPGTSDEEE